MKQKASKALIAFGIVIAIIAIFLIMIIGYFVGTAINEGSGSSSAKETAKIYEDIIELGKYKGIEVDKRMVTIDDITEEAIEDDITYLLDEYREYTEVTDRGIQDKDFVNFDFEGEINGEKPEDMMSEGYEITVGEGDFIEEFEEKMIGLKSGEETKIEITFPEDYGSYGGQKAEFVVKINTIQEVTLEPELTDEFVKEKMGYDSVEALKNSVKEDLYAQETESVDEQLYSDIMNIIVENSTLKEYSQELFDETKAEMEYEMEEGANMFQMSLEEYLEMFYGETEIPESWVTERILENGVTAMIMAKENFKLKDSEYNKLLEENLDMLGVETASEAEGTYGKEVIVDYFLSLQMQEFLIKEAKITELSTEEYDKKYEETTLEEEESVETE